MDFQKHLKQNGRFYLVHRPERVDEIIILADKYRVNVKEIQLVCTNKTNKPNLVLIKCVKNAKNNVIIKSVLNTAGAKSYQNIFGKGAK